MNHVDKLEKIESKRKERLLTVSSTNKGRTILANGPSRGANGFYWLFTNYSINEIQRCDRGNQTGSVDMKQLALHHEGLKHICKIECHGFRLVYNGIGGLGKKKTGGLKERILQEFNGGEKTGSLAIKKTSLRDLSRWRYSYVTITLTDSDFPDIKYDEWSLILERLWRLHYGWPLLCKK